MNNGLNSSLYTYLNIISAEISSENNKFNILLKLQKYDDLYIDLNNSLMDNN